MPAATRNLPFRSLALLLALVWTVLSLGWSWLLIRESYWRTLRPQIIANVTRLADDLAASVPADAQFSDVRAIARVSQLTQTLEDEQRRQPHMLYAVVWGYNGLIVAHTDRQHIASTLDPEDYPPLTPTQESRILDVKRSRFTTNTDVLEVTVPLPANTRRNGFLTVAYQQQWAESWFWPAQGWLVSLAVAFSLAGVVAILLGAHYADRLITRSQQQLEQTSRARTSLLTERGMLASVLAHEVRSPLTALRFNLYSLRGYINNAAATEKQLELADRCEREIRRLDLMLNDFLSRTQIIAPVSPTSINQVVREALAFLQVALEERHIRVVTHLDEAQPLVSVNPDELRQVLLNLASNAQDAMPKGGTLTISTVRDPEQATVTLLFRDAGMGIPPELHTRIFEPFFTTKPGGSGLGLALVRRVISGAGGTIFCESTPNEGTTFRVVLPQATVETSAPPPLESSTNLPDLVIDHTAEAQDPNAPST